MSQIKWVGWKCEKGEDLREYCIIMEEQIWRRLYMDATRRIINKVCTVKGKMRSGSC
jgi:hypothetical protein